MKKILRAITLCAALGCALYFFFFLTRIKEVTCQLDLGKECPTELAQDIQQKTMNQSLFFGHHNVFCNQLKKQRIEIDTCEVEKVFPDKVIFYLAFVPLRYTLFSPEKNLSYVIDQKGNVRNNSIMGNTVAGEPEPKELLVAFQIAPELEQTLSQNSFSPRFHSHILELLTQLPTLPSDVDYILLLNDREAQIYLKSQVKVWVELAHLNIQLEKLPIVLKQLPSLTRTHPISEIDLRFKYPVLREEVTETR